MLRKRSIWIIDTSVLLNLLDVPGFNQNREVSLRTFEERIGNSDTFLLPFTTILETGNHIAQLTAKDYRLTFAQKLQQWVLDALSDKVPWKPIGLPDMNDCNEWIKDFPFEAQRGVGLGDHFIIKHWEKQCRISRDYEVKIWSLDQHLQGYECNH